ncbi:DUF4410 domain-containing protein [Rickettsia endosymbiont of Halotydeus destructor]|uniref:DUF4410 domain-containing protein n=1 Tax=Rickettsia endosymbiont of Halotydeus destructor TaxID=2996754 RepID=UPI003BAEF984
MNKFIFLIMAVILSACGSTSSIKNSQKLDGLPNFNNYNVVIVNDFTDGVSKQGNDPNILAEGKRFADMIVSSIKSKNIFNAVERNVVDSSQHAILIDGRVIKYDEGNGVMRMLVGFGAGRSHFDAKVNIRDNQTNKSLGLIDVNKCSWLLGGAIAGSQDIKSHMNSAASKIATECAIAKNRKS